MHITYRQKSFQNLCVERDIYFGLKTDGVVTRHLRVDYYANYYADILQPVLPEMESVKL